MITFNMLGGQVVRYIEQIDCPIIQMGNYRIFNSPYNFGELEHIKSLQEELNKTRSQMITHRRRNVMKWMARRDRVDEDGAAAMQSSTINDIIWVDGNDPFENAIAPITPTQLAAD